MKQEPFAENMSKNKAARWIRAPLPEVLSSVSFSLPQSPHAAPSP
jgi:hypothetical protein